MIALEILVPICVCSIGTWHPIQTYICPPRTPSFVLLHVCLPLFGFLIACLLACFPSSCFFACLLACFHCHFMYMHGAWTLGVRARPPRRKQKGQGCKQEDANPQRAMFSRLGLLEWLHLSLSIIASSLEQCIWVLPFFVPFIFPTPCLGRVP